MERLIYPTCPGCAAPIAQPLVPAERSYRVFRPHFRCRVGFIVHPDGSWRGVDLDERGLSAEEWLAEVRA